MTAGSDPATRILVCHGTGRTGRLMVLMTGLSSSCRVKRRPKPARVRFPRTAFTLKVTREREKYGK